MIVLASPGTAAPSARDCAAKALPVSRACAIATGCAPVWEAHGQGRLAVAADAAGRGAAVDHPGGGAAAAGVARLGDLGELYGGVAGRVEPLFGCQLRGPGHRAAAMGWQEVGLAGVPLGLGGLDGGRPAGGVLARGWPRHRDSRPALAAAVPQRASRTAAEVFLAAMALPFPCPAFRTARRGWRLDVCAIDLCAWRGALAAGD
ncbi:hypothetical protein [Mangrovicoccus sp. HB161399]|uniref:hypothetical protein n=1 Tax=Mangrovicoccus sp. HB161399 TaxID=2720392 RepID=UPI001553CD36|nr:hypothetical protein [Mangrovicoccus sp. HB161399]